MPGKISEQMMEHLKDTLEGLENQTGESLMGLTNLCGFLAYASVNALKIETDYLNEVRKASTEIDIAKIKKAPDPIKIIEKE